MTDAELTRRPFLGPAGARTTLRISGPEDLLDALPRMLGFVPTRSAVLVALRPPRGRVALTMRIDLPPRPQEMACARHLAGHAQRAGATSAILVVYDDWHDGSRWRGAALTRAVRLALRERGGLRLSDALAVDAGRWRSLLCSDNGCCPPAGRPLRSPDDPSAAGAALAAGGAAVLPDRAALVASVAGPTGARAAQLLDLHRTAATDLADRAEAGCRVEALRTETVDRFRTAMGRSASGASPTDAQAARLVVGLVDIGARDAVLAWAADDDTDGLLTLLLDLAGRAVPPYDAPVMTALAWVSYARGDGGLANIAIDRALESDPGYSMARLVLSGLEAGIHPDHIRGVSRAVTEDE
ncbi:MAG: DUF4192 domain-containing protein [Actinomycetes bacterium]